MVLIAALTLALLASAALLAVGLRGRRTDDHPLCRRCGYDLTGRVSDRCAECGADLSRRRATRVGHRVRRRGPLAAGVVVVLASVAVLGTRGVAAARRLSDPGNQPVWWLQHKLNGTPADRDAALTELRTRVRQEQLTPAQVISIVDRILDLLASPAPWTWNLRNFVEDLHADHQLDAALWARYARQSFPVTLVARPTVRQGDPIPVEIAFDLKRAQGVPFEASLTGSALLIDGRPTRLTSSSTATVWGTFGKPNRPSTAATLFLSYAPFANSSVPEPTGDDTRLSPGRHTLSATIREYVFDATNKDEAPRGGTLPDVSKALVVFDVPLTATVTVYDAAHEPPLTVVDPSRRAAVAAAISAPGVRVDRQGTVWATANLAAMPVRVAFDVSVRPAGGGPELSSDTDRAPRWSGSPGTLGEVVTDVRGTLGPAERADLVLRPHLAGLRDGTNATPIWGQPVVVRDVPVTRGDR